MNENTAWAFILIALIICMSACEMKTHEYRVESEKIRLEQLKYCFDNGGEASWGHTCYLKKKITKGE